MSDFLKIYGETEGPCGFPMKDADAKALDALLQQHPGHEFTRAVVEKATTELSPGERADVSWIQTECLDRQRDVVLTSGFDDTYFKANPIVTLNHDYTKHPVGRSLWRRKVRDGSYRGIKAKTVYPAKSDDWPADQPWTPDLAFQLVKAGLLGGKSIGFLTLEAHPPTEEEVKKYPEWEKAWRIVTKWCLVEYCCTWLPVNPEAVVEAVSKSLVTAADLALVGHELPKAPPPPSPPPAEQLPPHTPLAVFEEAIHKRLSEVNLDGMVKKAVEEGYARVRGQV